MAVHLGDIVTKSDNHMEADIGSETLMMSVGRGRYYSVEETAQTIWSLIEKRSSVDSIVDALLEKYDVDRETCETETLLFLNALLDQNLIFLDKGR